MLHNYSRSISEQVNTTKDLRKPKAIFSSAVNMRSASSVVVMFWTPGPIFFLIQVTIASLQENIPGWIPQQAKKSAEDIKDHIVKTINSTPFSITLIKIKLCNLGSDVPNF